ncbi:MAG: 30S ribosomal protein S12 methylthiotransferase RimO [Emergencia sp.]|jgi:ribosomal protein S12 methylthiotransferase|uniref:30S ribosomal protein S12 methylthiotransferase RimO n=1 Tax=Anaerovoracaceae TaxID=543314 RepID=UPI00137949FF|nr:MULTISPECIES: 30S ribosomal protein S12 methylthiotransferase RimO [Clostridia]MCI9475433.1 30S ribosomal protein S12 methylthiotransferase RimO [Emergencia sp.]NCE98890.1 30S ribosomal protein S12 methylthiotransferase RimO [Emergencia sp. 1XD21-10]
MRIYIETLGCPKNFNDSQVAAGILENENHIIVNEPEDADIIMVNTCGFINDAKTESIEKILEMAEYKADGKKLVVSGCLSQRYADDLYKEMPEVDLFVGVNEYEKLPELFSSLSTRAVVCSNCVSDVLESQARKLSENPYTATIKIAEGCNNICAYCIIPKIRGKYRSKREEDILNEAEQLAAAGCKELILIAQDVTYYGKDLYGELRLAKLLKKLCKIDGIKWIRLMYCYEDRITDELIRVMAEEEKICNYLDIPIQHGSDSVLRAMNRRSTSASITNTLQRLRTAIPDIHIRTTLIVGFPGETEEDYETLVEFIEKEKFERLGVFSYSQEENTPAGEMENQVDEEIKAERLDGIMRRQIEISLESNQAKVGKTLEVLVEEMEEEGSFIGRTRYDAPEIDNAVIFTSSQNLLPGDMVKVLIQDAFDYDLVGTEV